MESRARPRAHHARYRRGRLARLCLRGDCERRPPRGAAGPGRTRRDDRTDRGYAARLITSDHLHSLGEVRVNEKGLAAFAFANPSSFMVAGVGFEPTTFGL